MFSEKKKKIKNKKMAATTKISKDERFNAVYIILLYDSRD